MSLRRIYLAGPDVFFPDADASYLVLEALCRQRGLQGVRPADGSESYRGALNTPEHGLAIYRDNLRRIRSCDAVLANLQAFRNPVEPDSGTVFEVGFAVALGIPVAGVVADPCRPLEHQVVESFGIGVTRNGMLYDGQFDYMIEAFGFPLNLMLACAAPMFATPEQALDALAARLRATP